LGKIPNFKGGWELNWPQQHRIGRQWGQISSKEQKNSIGGQIREAMHVSFMVAAYLLSREEKNDTKSNNWREP
jgi:hypothetical protein